MTGLSGSADRSVVLRADRDDDVPGDRQLRRVGATTSNRARRRWPASSCATQSPVASNWRAEGTLRDYLVANGIVAISDIDTRALTRHAAVRRRDARRRRDRAAVSIRRRSSSARAALPKMEGSDLVRDVTTGRARSTGPQEDPGEFGIAAGRRREAPAEDRRVRLRHEAEHPAAAERARLRRARVSRRPRPRRSCWRPQPDGVFLSNGPGDPAAADLRDRQREGARRLERAGVRHLPRPSDSRPRDGRARRSS